MRKPTPFCIRVQEIRARSPWLAAAVIGCSLWYATGAATALQDEAQAVYTDDSPDAVEILAKARDQRLRDNVPEAVRHYQRLLDDFDARLIQVEEAPTTYRSVRTHVHDELLSDPALLQAYRDRWEPEARALLDAGAFEEARRRFELTRAGLQAAFRLAEQRIRHGRFDAAVLILDELAAHPDLVGDDRRHRAELLALAGLYGDRSAAWESGTATLRESEAGDDSDWAQRVQAWHDQRSSGSPDVDDRPPSLAGVEDGPVWSYTLGHDMARLTALIGGSPESRQALVDAEAVGRYLSTAPLVLSDRVLVSDRLSIAAIDRYNGGELWRFDAAPNVMPQQIQILRTHDWGYATDAALLGYDGRIVAAIMEFSSDDVYRGGTNRMVAINALDGRVLWSVSPAELDPNLESSGFIGAPVVHEGRVYALVRKIARRQVSDFVVAIDGTGAPAWTRHLSSCAIGRRTDDLMPIVPLLHRGVLYVRTGTGSVAAIETDLGAPRWVRLGRPEFERDRYSVEPSPWMFDRPVATDAELVTFSPNRRELWSIDLSTGQLRASIAADFLGESAYLVGGGESVYVVGDAIRRLSPASLEVEHDSLHRFDAADPAMGRVAFVHGQLLAPSRRHLRLIDARDGTVLEWTPIETGGNLVVRGGEVVLATPREVVAYLPFDGASDALLARLNQNPDDAGVAMSLASLAFHHERFDALSDAVDAAARGVRAEGRWIESGRARLFELLAGMFDSHALRQSEPAERLLEHLSALATTADEQAAERLARARWLTERGHPEEAVEVYQAILTSPSLADAFWTSSDRGYRARFEAVRRLRELLATHGARLYAGYEALAAQELAGLNGAGGDELLALAERYPLASASVDAALQAAEAYGAAGRVDDAISALRRALDLDWDERRRGEVLGRLVRELERADRPDEAARELRMALRESPIGPLQDESGASIDARAWLARLEESASARLFGARIGPIRPEPMSVLPAEELLLPLYGAPSAGLALTRDRLTLAGWTADDLSQPSWTRPLASPSVLVLSIEPRSALLLIHGDDGSRTLESVSTSDGQLQWTLPLADIEGERRAVRATELEIPVVGADVILLTTPDGGLVCLDRWSGRQRWRVTNLAVKSGQMAVSLRGLVVAGRWMNEPLGEAAGQRLAVLDLDTGEVRASIQLNPMTQIRWITLADTGEVLYATDEALGCFDPSRGESRWETTDMALRDARLLSAVGSSLLVADAFDRAVAIEIESGVHETVAELAPGAGGADLYISTHRERAVLRTIDGLRVFDHEGRLCGGLARARLEGVETVAVALGWNRMAVLERWMGEPGFGNERLRLFEIDYTGRRLGPLFELGDRSAQPESDTAQLLDGWILVDAGTHVLAARAPVSDEEMSAPFPTDPIDLSPMEEPQP